MRSSFNNNEDTHTNSHRESFTHETNNNLKEKKNYSLTKNREIKVNERYLDPHFDDLLGWDIDEEEENVKSKLSFNQNINYMSMI